MTSGTGEDASGGTALVVAHPDDEILWFSSILEQVDRVLICFLEVPSRPDWSEGRRAAQERYPLEHARFLGLTESEVFNGADWQAPTTTEYGLAVARRPGTLPGYSAERYRGNFPLLIAQLGEWLHGCDRVYTHNPWGEYGHEEHVQVYRAVKTLQPRLGFEIWFDNYASNKSHALMMRYARGWQAECLARATNGELLRRLREFYTQHGCWTWFPEYLGFAEECLLPDREPGTCGASADVIPLNYLRIEAPWDVARERRGLGRAMRQIGQRAGDIGRRFGLRA